MQNKVTAFFLALLFPGLHLLIRSAVRPLAFAIALARIKERSPDLEEVFLRNQAALAIRSAEPWLLIASAALTLAAVFFFLRFTGPRPARPAKTGRSHSFVPLHLIGTALGLNIALNALMSLLPEAWIAEHMEKVSDPLAAGGPIPLFLCTVIAAPLAEEAVFRGLCFRCLQRAFSPLTAVVWQAVIFAAFHGTKLQMVYVFPAAIVLGLVYLRCGTLAAPVILHMAFNAVSLLPLPQPGSVWGQLPWLLLGAGVTALGMKGIWLRTRSISPRAQESISPSPPRQ